MKPNRLLDSGLLLLAIVVSYFFSMTNPNLGKMEMDALLNFYFPGFFGLILLILFLLFSFAFKPAYARARWPITGSLCLLIILLGLWLHFIS